MNEVTVIRRRTGEVMFHGFDERSKWDIIKEWVLLDANGLFDVTVVPCPVDYSI